MDRKRRILIVLTTGFKITSGITHVILNYYKTMDKSKYAVDFASYTDITDEIAGLLDAQKSIYHQLPHRKKKPLLYAWKLMRLSKGYDVIHVNGNSPTMAVDLLAARLSGVPVRIAHSHSSKTEHPVLCRLLQPLFRLSYTKGVACSDKAGDWLFGKDGFVCLPNAIDMSRYFASEEARQQKKQELALQDKIVVGHVGRFSPEKNHGFLLEVFQTYCERNERACLLLIGGGPLLESIKARVRERGLAEKVLFTGAVTDVSAYLPAIDVFVFPSLFEGLPLALVEAQAADIPCLISDAITDEVMITDLVCKLSLNDPASLWAEKIDSSRTAANDQEQDRKRLLCSAFHIENALSCLESLYDGRI